ncbi:TPA: hypothetical protein L1145_004229 [Escherichia coli]|nr:hypothetical protein [Escherichia coli]MDZ9305128.1 hypothetical protein [Escherichia coli]HBN2182341.1 hypothetical protein [Escherichia coli]
MKAVAVIGLGNIADRHRRNLKKVYPGIKVYAMSASGRKIHGEISDCDQVVNIIDELWPVKITRVIKMMTPVTSLQGLTLKSNSTR